MVSPILFLIALLPVIAIGTALMEMLLHSAPRRGKWPYPPEGTPWKLPALPSLHERPTTHAERRPALACRVVPVTDNLLLDTPEGLVSRIREMDAATLAQVAHDTRFSTIERTRALELLRQWEEADLIRLEPSLARFEPPAPTQQTKRH